MTTFIKRVALLIIAFGLTATFSMGAEEIRWKHHRSADGHFSADFPGKPEHLHQSIKIPESDLTIENDTYISESSDKVVFVASNWHYPDEIDMSQAKVNLEEGFTEMLSALPHAEVEEMELSKKDGVDQLSFRVENDDIVFEGKLLLQGNDLDQVFAVYKKDVNVKGDLKHFLDSFKIEEPHSHSEKAPKAKILKLSL